MTERDPLSTLDVEAIRFRLEHELAATLEAEPGFALRRKAQTSQDPTAVRRRLMAQAMRLTESMAADAHRQARQTARRLGVEGTIELYQSSGRENAALHLIREPILLEIQGRMLSLLDEGAALALFGHELGHYLAHGPWNDLGSTAVAGVILAEQGLLSTAGVHAARRLVVAQEITADRFGLIAAPDLDAALRLEMAATTGLPGSALHWDTQAYLEQCRELMEQTLERGDAAHATATHPEHSLRAWALWLYSQSAEYQALTGRGPGARPLAEIDALVANALGQTELGSGFDVRDEPPTFLVECALAGAVLIAHADGVVAPEELDAIEDAFASRVPGWSEVLDPDVALERFYETGGLVRAAGPDLARSLFLLLSHVMGADDVIDAREVQMLLSIGEALGYAAEFRHWVRPTIEATGAPLEIETLETVAVPLPMRRDEVRDALEALADAVARRGEARVSPRRLLRLAGSPVEDADARSRLERVLAQHQVECTPALAHAGLDQAVRLRSTRPPAERVADEGEALDGSRASLVTGLNRLRDDLVTGDGRSPSVRLRSLRAARAFDVFRLDAVRRGAAERVLALVTAGKPARLVTADDAGRHDAAHACSQDLRGLDRAHRDRREETGANDMYLGYPIVVGNVAPRGQTGPGYGVRAPLLLYPIRLERDGRGARGFSAEPREGEGPIANRSLLRVLFNKAELALPDALGRALDEHAGDPAGGIDAVLATLAEVGLVLRREGSTLGAFRDRNDDLDRHGPFLALEECALLGLFAQSSSDLLQDYDALLPRLNDASADLESILAAGLGLLPGDDEAAVGSPPDTTEPDAEPGRRTRREPVPTAAGGSNDDGLRWPVLPADPSQREVATVARRHRITVVDGPPGTGKSQLIVNLVAEALGRGERVAVVAEKRAALDVVYQRLDGCGLTDSAALVHDVADDRRPLYRKIAARLRDFAPRADDHSRRAVLQQEHAQRTERLVARRARLAHRKEGLELTVGQLLSMMAGEAPLSAPALADLDQRGLSMVLELVERLHPHRELWSPNGWWRQEHGRSRASLASMDDAGLVSLRRTLEGAVPSAEALDASLADDPVERDALARASDALEPLHRGREARSDPFDARAFVALLEQPNAPIEPTRRLWDERSTALARCPTPTEVATDEAFVRHVVVLRSFAGRWSRMFSGVWWRARGAVRRGLVQVWPEQAAAGLSAPFLERLHDRVTASEAWEASARLLAGLGLNASPPVEATEGRARLERLSVLQAQAQAARADASRLEAIGVALPDSPATVAEFEQRLEQRHEQRQRQSVLVNALRPATEVFSCLGTPAAGPLRALVDHLEHDGHRLRETDGWLAQLDAHFAAGRALLDSLVDAHPDATVIEWREAVARAWAAAHLAGLHAVMPDLADLGTAAESQRAEADVERLGRLDGELRAQEIARVHAVLDRAPLLHVPDAGYRARRSPQQKLKEGLLKEVGKKRMLWPMRRFVREFAPQGLLDVMPCWLLSPETMVVLFPPEALFDLVIFDEASQCTVESGVPVTLRAHRVVIAGDEQQMPPSSFFRLGRTGTDDEDRSEQERSARDVFAAESLLALARARCPHVGLSWHYRCREEELIAFSNHAMYEGSLLTVPSTRGPAASPALRWVSVEGGQYDRGLNRPEAEVVVDQLDGFLRREPAPTVGIVTFNLRQRETIIEAIEARAEADEDFAARWAAASTAETLDTRLFVKNLESVQGDERDIIVFSLGHAPITRTRRGGRSEPYVPARFGPLGQRGGERRLNVAISRAKAECHVVSSFDPELLHVGQSTHSGPRLFKAYLEFAHSLEHGKRAQAERILDEVRGRALTSRRPAGPVTLDGYVPLEAQLALALESRGLRCALHLGSSDFRIPLAVGHPDDAERFAVAVMCDEGDRDVSVFEQHVHRPAVLRLRGWTLVPVTAADWARRPYDVLAAIEGTIRTKGSISDP